MDIASSIQVVIEKIILNLATSIQKETNIKNLCLAGGVALNCVANGKILKRNIFENIWIQQPLEMLEDLWALLLLTGFKNYLS